MSCIVVYAYGNEHLENKRFASHAAVARAIPEDATVSVQETSGTNEGWYRTIHNKGEQYAVSRPQMDY